jgi:syntaxin-binding protein 1
MSKVSLRTAVKERLLKEMLGALPEKGWKVLIVDKHTLSVVSAACKVSDLMARNITVVESIDKKRQPFPQMEGVYFISPSEETAKMVLDDLEKKKYGSTHLFFSSPAPNSIIKIIGGSRMAKTITTCVDLNLDFLAIESNIFTFKEEEDIRRAFFQPDIDAYAKELSDKLLTFCLTVKEIPHIRFNVEKGKNRKIAELTAVKLRDKLDEYKKNNKNEITKQAQKSVLLICDRSIDAIAPLLHEFTYQAMTIDNIEFERGNIFLNKTTNNEGKEIVKKVMIDENDEIWVNYRSRHISESSVGIKKELKDFLDKSGMGLKKEDKDKMKMEDVGTMIRKLPQYQSKIGGYSLHINLNKTLMDIFKKEFLNECATEEQNMATGQDADGNTPKSLVNDLSALMRKNGVTQQSKLRLIMLYTLTKGNKDYRDKFIDLAKINDGERNALYNVTSLKPPSTFSFDKMFKKMFTSKPKSQEVDYTLSRYVPVMKGLCEDLLKGTLSEKEYKYVDVPGKDFKIDHVGSGKKEVKEEKKEGKGRPSRFGDQPQWTLTENSNTSLVTTEMKKSDYRLFLFVIGGLTYSEMRSAYELSNEYGIDVMFGGTSIITPKDYIYKLGIIEGGKQKDEDE